MLTPRQIELVKATVPVLREHGVALTTHFYRRMLEGNPELKNIFNQVHQARGRQQKALAGAVLAYAENIENPAVLLPAVKFIASKHATVGIRAEHYPIVGRHLLASIREVLGEAATDELVDAWAAAYGQLADLMIKVESGIYEAQANAEGGWSGWRPFVVAKRVDETPDVVSFYLKPADGGRVPGWKPGQFVSVRAYLPELNLMQPRQYSLSAAPGSHEEIRISVKRIDPKGDAPAGLMSNHLHKRLKAGDTIDVSAPAGEFHLAEGSNPVFLAAGGIGVTPILAMLESIVENTPERPVTFIQAARTAGELAFVKEVRAAAAKGKHVKVLAFVTQPAEADMAVKCPCVKLGARPGLEDVRALAPSPDADAYLCGPGGFMADMRAALEAAGVPAKQIHAEVFGTGGEA